MRGRLGSVTARTNPRPVLLPQLRLKLGLGLPLRFPPGSLSLLLCGDQLLCEVPDEGAHPDEILTEGFGQFVAPASRLQFTARPREFGFLQLNVVIARVQIEIEDGIAL